MGVCQSSLFHWEDLRVADAQVEDYVMNSGLKL